MAMVLLLEADMAMELISSTWTWRWGSSPRREHGNGAHLLDVSMAMVLLSST
jgi:hypothetical protein